MLPCKTMKTTKGNELAKIFKNAILGDPTSPGEKGLKKNTTSRSKRKKGSSHHILTGMSIFTKKSVAAAWFLFVILGGDSSLFAHGQIRRGRIRPLEQACRGEYWVQYEDTLPDFYTERASVIYVFPEIKSVVLSLDLFQLFSLEQRQGERIELDQNRALVPSMTSGTTISVDDAENKNPSSVLTDATKTVMTNETAPDWGFVAVQAQQLHSQSIRGQGIKVCVIDTGVSIPHPDLKNSSFSGFSPNTTIPWDVDVYPVFGHGTHVAGIIVADDRNDIGIKGVAPDADIFVFQFFGGNRSRSSDLVYAANKCVEAGARIINVPFKGTEPNEPEREAFDRLFREEDVLIVAAAGDDGIDAAPSYPASYDGVISVAAIDSLRRRPDFSQDNEFVDLVGPGVDVLSTSTLGFDLFTGTSLSAAFVSAVAALLWSYQLDATAADIRDALFAGALDLGDVMGRDADFGYGLVQALRSLEVLQSSTAPTATQSLLPTVTPPSNQPTSTPTPGTTLPPSIFSCSPSTFEFVLDFGLDCDQDNITSSRGIAATSCNVSPLLDSFVTDFVPVKITRYQVVELGLDLSPISAHSANVALRDGDSFEFTSINELNRLDEVPAVLQIILTAENSAGEFLLNTVVIFYTNANFLPVVEVGNSIGWVVVSKLTHPSENFCPVVSEYLS